MAWLSQFPTSDDLKRQAEKALHVQIGMASPLWLAFGAAASAGAAWWWASRLTGMTNLESLLGSRLAGMPAPPLIAEILAEADAEAEPTAPAVAIEPVAAEDAVVVKAPIVEAAAEPGVIEEPIIETVPEPAEWTPEPAESAPEPDESAPEPAGSTLQPADDDDLTRLVGVGPKVARALAERGVTRFAQLAAWTVEDMARFDAELKLLGRGTRDAWIAQAKRLATEN